MVIPPQMPQQPIEACDLFGWADAASGRPGVKATQRKEKAATASALPTDVAVPAEPTTNAAEPHSIEISALCIEPELAIRHGLCKAAIVDYAARTERGEQCPPVLVYEIDGKLVLVDGHHRIAALERLDKTSVNAIIVVGSLEEAFEAAIRANRCHGVRLTNKDKRVIVIQALNLFGGKRDRLLAAKCGVSDRFVAGIRKRGANGSQLWREGLDGKTYRVSGKDGKGEPTAAQGQRIKRRVNGGGRRDPSRR